jgi:hypothetical protein
MSITDDRNKRETTVAETIDWRAEQSGLWVARRNGVFVGMVEARWGSGFAATTRLAKPLGTFTTVEEAQAALEESLTA